MVHRKKQTRAEGLGARLLSVLWLMVAVAAVLVALALSAARMFFTADEDFSKQVEIQLGAYIGLPVEIEELEAAWRGVRPELKLKQVRVLDSNSGKSLMELREIRVAIDLFHSLLSRKVQPSSITLVGTRLPLERTKQGRIRMSGFPEIENAPDMISLVLGQKRFSLSDVELVWDDLADEQPPFQLSNVQFHLKNKGSRRRFRINARLPEALGRELQVIGDLKWSPGDVGQLVGDLYVQGAGVQLSPLNELGFQPDVTIAGETDFQFWAKFNKGQLQELQSKLQLQSLGWDSESASQPVHVADSLHGLLRWQRGLNGWSLTGENLTLKRNGKSWPTTRIQASVTGTDNQSEQQISLAAEHLDLRSVLTLARQSSLIPDEYRDLVRGLDLEGELYDVQIDLEHKNDGSNVAAFTTTFSKLGGMPWEKVPGIHGLSGTVRGSLQGGELNLDSSQLTVDAPRLFRSAINVDRFASVLNWRKGEQGLQLDASITELNNEDIKLAGRIGLEFPDDGSSPLLDMQLSIHDSDVGGVGKYLPAHVMPAGAVKWIDDALVGGDISTAAVLFQGRPADYPFTQGEGTLQAIINVEQVILDYRKDWPRIEALAADIVFRNESMIVRSAGGSIFNAELEEVTAEIADLKHSGLKISGIIPGPVTDMLRFLKESPLDETIGDPLGPVVASGETELVLSLDIPLRDKNASVAINGTLQLSDNSLRYPDLNLLFSGVNGKLEFTQDEVKASNISASLRGKSVQAQVGTDIKDGNRETWIDIGGQLGLIDDLRALDWPVLSPRVSGSTFWEVMLRVSGGSDRNTGKRLAVEVRSDLKGVQLDLPKPLRKEKDSVRSLRVNTILEGGQFSPIRVTYGDEFSAVLKTVTSDQGIVVERGGLRFGSGPAQLPKQSSLELTGRAVELPVMKWLDLMTTSKKSGALPFRLKGLNVEYLHGIGLAIERTKIDASESAGKWNVELRGPNSEGTLVWLANEGQRGKLQVNMDRLEVAVGPQPDSPPGNPALIPLLDIAIKKAVYNGIDLGTVFLQTSPDENGMRVDWLEMQTDWAHAEANGFWREQDGQQSSEFHIVLSGDDLGKLLDVFGFVGSVSGGKTEASLTATWIGAPSDFTLAGLNGGLNLDVKNGQLLEVEPGAGRIFGLLSLQALPSRLLGNFGDLFKKGFGFDEIKGNFILQEGDAFTSDLLIEGPAASIGITGRTGFAAQDYDQTLKIAANARASLPLAGVIAVSPVAGAAIFLADKLLPKSTGTEYRLTGSWEDPVLERVVEEKSTEVDVFAEEDDN